MKEWKEGIFKPEEKVDTEKFSRFFDSSRLWQWSAETEYGAFADVVCQDKSGHTFAIELKSRSKIYGDIFIEPKKMENMRDLSRKNGVVPIYINFCGDKVYYFNLMAIKEAAIHYDVTIYKNEVVDRIGLSLSDARIYEWREGELVQVQEMRNPEPEVKQGWERAFFNNRLDNSFLKSTWEKNE